MRRFIYFYSDDPSDSVALDVDLIVAVHAYSLHWTDVTISNGHRFSTHRVVGDVVTIMQKIGEFK